MAAFFLRKQRWRYVLLGVWRDWLRDDGQSFLYVIKVLLACLLALWVSLRFELEQPRTALLTVMIVMQARTSMVLAKSYYRFWGTIVGIAASLILVGLFAQERILFLGYLAVWIGFCTAGSMAFRHHQSYAFVLAGYTICIVGLPATLNPGLTFDIAMTRFSEIMVGLISASLISAIIFPQGVGDLLKNAVRKRYRDLSSLLRSLNLKKLASANNQAATLHMVGDIFELESFHASSGMESDHSRTYRQRLNLLNTEFMTVTTSFHALEQLLRRLYNSGQQEVVDGLLTLFHPIQLAVQFHQREVRNEQEAMHAAMAIKALRDHWPLHLNQVQATLPDQLTTNEQLDFATGAELTQRVLEELHAYTNTYAGLDKPGSVITIKQAPRLGLHFDPLAALLAGIRGALVLTVMATIWIVFDWRSGIEAITIGMITSTLFASTPSPSKTVRHFIIGALIGTILLYICNFQLLPQAQGFPMLALALIPTIALATWITTIPSIAVIGTGIFLIFLTHIGFNQVFSANPVTFINDAIADLMAIMIAGLFYNLIDLTNNHWSRTRVAAAMRELIQDACLQELPQQRVHLETQARELMLRMGAARRVADAKDKEVVDWLLSTLEIGHAVLAMRAQLTTINDPALRGRIQQSLLHIARLFGKPSSRLRNAAIKSITRSIDQLQENETREQLPQSSYRELLTMLHFIRCALLDTESVLSLSAPLTPNPHPTMEPSHA